MWKNGSYGGSKSLQVGSAGYLICKIKLCLSAQVKNYKASRTSTAEK